MSDIFTFAVRYWIKGSCLSPLRTGNAYNDTEEVLRYADDMRPFLQGTSLAGVLKSSGIGTELFGSQKSEGSLLVSDCVFDDGTKMKLRPRLRIDGATGTADTENKSKFDIAHIETGSKFNFALTWRGGSAAEQEAAREKIEQMLSALNAGQLRLGAQRSNGMGRVSLDETWVKTYSLCNESDRECWIAAEDDFEKKQGSKLIELPDVQSTAVCFEVICTMPNVLVKDSAGIGVGEDGIDAINQAEAGLPVIPGSSIKGAMRAHLGTVAQYMGGVEKQLQQLFGSQGTESEQGCPGKLIVSDGIIQKRKIKKENWKVSRIRINRFTGGVVHGGLFSERPESGECKFSVTLPNGEPLYCKLITFALRDLGLGLYTLGSGMSIGRGRVENMSVKITTPNSKAEFSIVGETKDVQLQDKNDILKSWLGGDGQ